MRVASQDGDSPAGFEARLDLQNAEGGVNGHKLVPARHRRPDQPLQDRHGGAEADSKAFGIVSQSPLFFLAAKYPKQAGVPVTGSYDDGPEWGTQPYTNMFASDQGSVDPKLPGQHADRELPQGARRHRARLLRLRRSRRRRRRAAIANADSFKHAGGKVGVLDTTIPFGSVDFTSTALVAKQNSVNAIIPALDYELELRPGHRAQAGRASSFKAVSSPPATSPA